MAVSVPPVWNASRGSNDMPTMMQKMASDPNRQARCTVSNAIRRISSMAPPALGRTAIKPV